MKLIIDIPRSEYMEIKRYYDSLPEYSTVEAETYYIAPGTPLDDVKAEIVALPKTYPFVNHIDTYVKEDDVLQILDNIGKESKTN